MKSLLLRTLIIYFTVIVAMRLMGKRQLGELQPSELVTTFLISNVASICIDEPDLPLISSLASIFFIAALEIFNSSLCCIFPKYALLCFGRPVTVIQNGEINQDALRHLRLSANDLAEALRCKDVFDPTTVHWAVVEPNGSISIALAPEKGEDAPLLPIFIDGIVYQNNLQALQHDEKWLNEQFESKKTSEKEVFMFLTNGSREFWVQKKTVPSERSEGKTNI